MLFVFSAGFPPFDDATEVDLTLHMLQHILIIFSGVLIAYPHLGRRLPGTQNARWPSRLALLAAGSLVVVWHFPVPWDVAVMDPAVHVVEHLSFLLVGFLAGSWLLLLSDSGKIGALMAAFFGHMGYAVALISPWNVRIYSLYSLQNQTILGWVLLLTGPFLVVGVAYVIARNPAWLGGFSGSKFAAGKRSTFLNRVNTPNWVPVLSTFVLAAILIGYFSATAYAIGTAQGAPSGGPIVYIVESPFSWQYSPQDVTVQLGVNATVTWVSHSISYDTVTDASGGFSSGAIAPGQTFVHVFNAPGVYHYYCRFHPWMTGTVKVLASGA
jgi:plastocyanin